MIRIAIISILAALLTACGGSQEETDSTKMYGDPMRCAPDQANCK